MKKIQINVDPKVYEKFQKICKERDVHVSQMLRKYMKKVVEEENQ